MWAAFLFVSDGLIGWDDIDTRSVLSAALERILTTEMFINMNLEEKKMPAIKKILLYMGDLSVLAAPPFSVTSQSSRNRKA